MKSQENREVLTAVYRLVEKYEQIPVLRYQKDAESYFTELCTDCLAVCAKFPENVFAKRLTVALYGAVEEQFKAVNKVLIEEQKNSENF